MNAWKYEERSGLDSPILVLLGQTVSSSYRGIVFIPALRTLFHVVLTHMMEILFLNIGENPFSRPRSPYGRTRKTCTRRNIDTFRSNLR